MIAARYVIASVFAAAILLMPNFSTAFAQETKDKSSGELKIIPADPEQASILATTNFSDSETVQGCNGQFQTWSISGYIFNTPTTGNLFRMTHNFPFSV